MMPARRSLAPEKEDNMTGVHILAIDLAKRSFQVCATALGEAVLFNRTVSRAKLEKMLPRQRSTGGKIRLGSVSKMGPTDIRGLLIVGAMSRIRWIVRKGVLPDNWLGRVLGRKPRMVAAVALANKMARMVWAMMTREQDYRMA
jgi:transposase